MRHPGTETPTECVTNLNRPMTSTIASRSLLFHSLLLSWLVVLTSDVQAQVVSLDWDAQGKFDRNFVVPPGQFVELCAKLQPGLNVAWSFSSAEPMDFNIHYHEGKDVRMPARADQSRSSSGLLAVTSSQDYCWMWTNKTPTPGNVAVQLSRSGNAR